MSLAIVIGAVVFFIAAYGVWLAKQLAAGPRQRQQARFEAARRVSAREHGRS
jgi:hypothetical protein